VGQTSIGMNEDIYLVINFEVLAPGLILGSKLSHFIVGNLEVSSMEKSIMLEEVSHTSNKSLFIATSF